MSPRDRRRFLIGLTALVCVLFAAARSPSSSISATGLCVQGGAWIWKHDNGIGEVTFTCPGGKTVTQGILPSYASLPNIHRIHSFGVFATGMERENEIELASRRNGGVEVRLLWRPGVEALTVSGRRRGHRRSIRDPGSL